MSAIHLKELFQELKVEIDRMAEDRLRLLTLHLKLLQAIQPVLKGLDGCDTLNTELEAALISTKRELGESD